MIWYLLITVVIFFYVLMEEKKKDNKSVIFVTIFWPILALVFIAELVDPKIRTLYNKVEIPANVDETLNNIYDFVKDLFSKD